MVEATLLSAEEQAQELITGTQKALGGLNEAQVNLAPLKVLAGRPKGWTPNPGLASKTVELLSAAAEAGGMETLQPPFKRSAVEIQADLKRTDEKLGTC